MKKVFLSLVLCFSLHLHARETILVTAATGALGGSVCEMAASSGYDLMISGRNMDKLNRIKETLMSKYKDITVKTVIIDFSDISTIEVAAQTVDKLQGIVLIGPRPTLSKTEIPSKEEWATAFSETFIAPLEVLRVFGSKLENEGSIVVMSGETSKRYLPNYPNTNVMRLAWSGQIKNLVQHFGNRKIRVNAVSPGIILTPLHEERIKTKAASNQLTFEEQLEQETSSIPLRRYGKIEDVSNLILFLLSTKSAHVNGSNILLDGGASDVY